VSRRTVGLWLERVTEHPPLTLNIARQNGEWAARRELQQWRAWAKEEAKGVEPILGPVTVTVVHLRPTRASMPDVGAPMLAAKAVIDGIVEARVLPSDGPDVVTRLTFETPEVVGHHGLRVIVRVIEQHVTKDQPAPNTVPIHVLTQGDGD
jgi:hypothetical protein